MCLEIAKQKEQRNQTELDVFIFTIILLVEIFFFSRWERDIGLLLKETIL